MMIIIIIFGQLLQKTAPKLQKKKKKSVFSRNYIH